MNKKFFKKPNNTGKVKQIMMQQNIIQPVKGIILETIS